MIPFSCFVTTPNDLTRVRYLLAVLALAFGCGGDTPTSSAGRVPTGPFLARQSVTIALGSNTLFPGQFQLRHVTLDDDPKRFNYHLSGDFSVSDGYSIEAFLMKREDVPEIVEGRDVERLWRTGVTQATSWEITMTQVGNYTFVLDNRVGEPEWKTVTTRLILSWDQF